MNAPVDLGEWVRDPDSSGIDPDWCGGAVADRLDGDDPRWMTYLVQRWFPDRKSLPAFPRDDGPGLVWWYAAWGKALDIPLPVDLVKGLHITSSSAIIATFLQWVESIASRAHDRVTEGVGAREFPIDLWHWLSGDERDALELLLRRLAAAHRP